MLRNYEHTPDILPFDHRGSFETKMFGWNGALGPAHTARIAAAKQVIYDGLQAAIAAGHGFVTACPMEMCGRDEFDFEYGDDVAAHIETFRPTFCTVLVRYDPGGDVDLYRRQATRLKRLSDYLQGAGRSRFMFELPVPLERAQLDVLNGDTKGYDPTLRPQLSRRYREFVAIFESVRTH